MNLKNGGPCANRKHFWLYKKYKHLRFHDERRPMQLIQEAGGKPLQRPRVPAHWKVQIIPHFGLKYINPENREEWVKVLPGNPKSLDAVYRVDHAIYHWPEKKEKKEFKNLTPFDTQGHDELLTSLREEHSDLSKRARAAHKALRGYSFRLQDVITIRKKLGFPDLPKDAVVALQEKICACHSPSMAQTQGGVMFKHRADPYFATRLAQHFSEKEGFIKVQTKRGYGTITGATTNQTSEEAHISIEDLLDFGLGWYSPPCEKVYDLYKFDYWKETENQKEVDFPSKPSANKEKIDALTSENIGKKD